MADGQSPRSSPVDPAEESRTDPVTEKLRKKFAGVDGPLSDEEVSNAVHDANEELRDAPVQAFVPLIAENNARNRLQERVDDDEAG